MSNHDTNFRVNNDLHYSEVEASSWYSYICIHWLIDFLYIQLDLWGPTRVDFLIYIGFFATARVTIPVNLPVTGPPRAPMFSPAHKYTSLALV